MTGEGKILKTGDCFSIICMQCGIPTCKQDFIINSQKLHNCCCSGLSDARGRFWSQAFFQSCFINVRMDGDKRRHRTEWTSQFITLGSGKMDWFYIELIKSIFRSENTKTALHTHSRVHTLILNLFGQLTICSVEKTYWLAACVWAERMGRSGRCISPVIVGQSGVRYATSSWKKSSQNCGCRTLEKACFCVGFCSDFDSTKWYIVNYSEKVNSWTRAVSHCQRQWPPLTSEVPLTSEDFLFGESIVWGLCHHPLAIDVGQFLVWRRQCKHHLAKTIIWNMKFKTLFGTYFHLKDSAKMWGWKRLFEG